ncbi:hypothetical protein [Lentzea pudingi]|uniref:hypothetical protein n=1 Tax=Lentzea pudingi TaxID=1789439 RepID=UPI001E3BB033|nr:hypothetical protein [Lentzea pudingi]
MISISDGRDYVHQGIAEHIKVNEDRLVRSLSVAGHDVVAGSRQVSDNGLAVSVSREVAAAGVDLTILHYAVWAFPHFTMLAAAATPSPLVLVSTIDPVQPGLVGMLAAGGALDQIGRGARPAVGRHRRPRPDQRDRSARDRGVSRGGVARLDLRQGWWPADGDEHRGGQY